MLSKLLTMPIGRALLVIVLCAPFHAAQAEDLFASPLDRAKWKSLGVKNWVAFDPFERALPSRPPPKIHEWKRPTQGTRTSQLKALIAFAEAGPKGYNAVHHGATKPPPKAPTQLTLGDIDRWIRSTPGQPHAIGRYQFIPSTLRSLQRRLRLPPGTPFSPQVQDRMADLLLSDAGYAEFLKGRIGQKSFMNRLALIWAGLPRSNGRSAYHGYAGNRATISLAFYRREVSRIFGTN